MGKGRGIWGSGVLVCTRLTPFYMFTLETVKLVGTRTVIHRKLYGPGDALVVGRDTGPKRAVGGPFGARAIYH